MNLETKSSHRKALISVVLIALLLGIASFVTIAIRKEKAAIEEVSINPGKVTLEGAYICLPYTADAPTENRVCDFGLRTDAGVLYSLDFNLLTQPKPELKTGDRIKAQGVFTPIEALSSDYFTKRYNIKGIFSVTDSISVAPTKTTTSNGIITFSRPAEFGLALNPDQILVSSYIPPCDSQFDYCVYYNGREYEDTNFGSAGVRIKKRNDLANTNSCINTSPAGYTDYKPTKVATTSAYTLSMFPIGDAGMGHSASGELYRLSYKSTCHEFETRISSTQFANYPEGTKRAFIDTQLKGALRGILDSIELSGGEKLTF